MSNNLFSEKNLLLQYPYSSKNKVLVDVGAHEGFVSEPFAKLGWNVIAFEPEKENREVFIEKLGSMSNVTCIPKAVSDKSGLLVEFYVSEKHYGIHSLKPFHATHRKSEYNVETITINDALDEFGIEDITILKIDIEGADFLALKGTNFDKYHPEIILVEFMDERSLMNFNYSHHDIVRYMKMYGFIAYVSEWAPVKEYGVKGKISNPHSWLRCEKYPLTTDPAWGNLIFINENKTKLFENILRDYSNSLHKRKLKNFLKKMVNKMKSFKSSG
jgi:FkbM family methyltransferase